ncbi:uncharacterized protein LOC118517398 [Anopheles stephensi]|uniref:uncharacterized protein LOC118517398 n=1 Tax=Anopheles stephensi TaxID=30069 RepID=UPI001658A5FF|nr:uncharacterized protein LOC118517398 [Anopheles stephensi]
MDKINIQPHYGTRKVYARYPMVFAQQPIRRSMHFYESLTPLGKIRRTEHIGYERFVLPENRVSVGDAVLQIGTVTCHTVVNAEHTGRSLYAEFRNAKSMVLKQRNTGEIYEVAVVHRLNGPTRPFVKVYFRMHRLFKSRSAPRTAH